MTPHFSTSDLSFSKETIYEQLQKIFLDPFFANSGILRKFLTFIVDETLAGHANWLKEYTIGLKVLNKSAGFKPQENGIVRIHAGRLRRALNHYYNGSGITDSLFISVPKGSYVPVFERSDGSVKRALDVPVKLPEHEGDEITTDRSVTVAVIPFSYLNNDPCGDSLAEGLGLQLSTALMKLERLCVIAYYTVQELCNKRTDIISLSSIVGAQYIITGNIQTQGDRIRIHAQLINTPTYLQLWSRMYERKFTTENIFDLQDEIINLIMLELKFQLIADKAAAVSITAVA